MIIRPRLRRSATSSACASCASTGSCSCATCRRRSPIAHSRELLYRSHPYGHLPIGTEASLRGDGARRSRVRFTRDVHPVACDGGRRPAMRRTTRSRRSSTRRSAAGRRARDADRRRSRRRCPRRRRRPSASPCCTGPARRSRSCASATSRVPRSTPDYHALLVLNMVLGGQFVSRINMNLREDKGYTYGARTSFDFRRGPGPFVLQASVQSDATADAVLEAMSELAAIRGERPVTRGGARDRPRRADARLSAQFRDRRADQPRRRAARAVRSARRLLLDVRAEGARGRRSGGHAGRRSSTSTRRAC